MTLPPSHFLSHKEQAQALRSPLELADSATQGHVFFFSSRLSCNRGQGVWFSVCGFPHNLPFPIYLSSSATHLLVFHCCQVGIWRQCASGAPGQHSCWAFRGPALDFFTGWHLSMCKRLGGGRKIESYLITSLPSGPWKEPDLSEHLIVTSWTVESAQIIDLPSGFWYIGFDLMEGRISFSKWGVKKAPMCLP